MSDRPMILRLISRVRAGLLDLVDVGVVTDPAEPACRTCRETGRKCDVWPACNHPREDVRDRYERKDGNFQPTPKTAGRSSGVSDPTRRSIEAWESEVERAVTGLHTVVVATVSIVDDIPTLTPRDEHDRPHPPPRLLPTRTSVSGRTVAQVDPATARVWTVEACQWLAAFTDRASERLRTEPDPSRATWISGVLWDVADGLARLHRSLLPDRPVPTRHATDQDDETSTPCRCTHRECPHHPKPCHNTVTDRHRDCSSCRRRQRQTQDLHEQSA